MKSKKGNKNNVIDLLKRKGDRKKKNEKERVEIISRLDEIYDLAYPVQDEVVELDKYLENLEKKEFIKIHMKYKEVIRGFKAFADSLNKFYEDS